MTHEWYAVDALESTATPALAVYPSRVMSNVQKMKSIAGSVDRLWPHVKTHKTAELVRLQRREGIHRFKCATLAEAEVTAQAGAAVVLLAYPMAGPNPTRLARLAGRFPHVRFSTLVDNPDSADQLNAAMAGSGLTLGVWIDVDVGMGRTGMPLTAGRPTALYERLAGGEWPNLIAVGFHAYDGHVRDRDPTERAEHAERCLEPLIAMRLALVNRGLGPVRLMAGGTPTFAAHAQAADRDLSPGTCVLWDASYSQKFPDLGFEFAAVLLTRVVSKPMDGRLCLDLGYKAVASDNPDPRAVFLDVPDARMVVHSEEHLVIETARAGEYSVGDVLYAIPFHVCPTCALHRELLVVEGRQVVDRWPVAGRDRRLSDE
jgi:D-serine deaminase-like pyridoxal phosphate-dependent protein